MARRIKTPKEKVSYEIAPPEVEEIARDLIRRYHQHLLNAKIVYVFRGGEWKKGGKTILGQVEKAGGKMAFWVRQALHIDRPDVYPMYISKRGWATLSHDQRLALIDHELCHWHCTDTGKIVTIGHDVEEFRAVLERHGFWENELRRFGEAAAKCQGSLEFAEPKREEVSA